MSSPVLGAPLLVHAPGRKVLKTTFRLISATRIIVQSDWPSIKKRLAGGALHALVNNAGISPKGEEGARLGPTDTGMATWRLVFEVNFFAPIVLARGLMAELVKGQGSIVNVTSIAGSRVHPFAGTAYATSKAALAALTREMASDFGQKGIRVNAIAPGEIDTPILSPRYIRACTEYPHASSRHTR